LSAFKGEGSSRSPVNALLMDREKKQMNWSYMNGVNRKISKKEN